MTRPAMVVAPQPEAAEAAVVVLRNGGNAVDAAMAAAFAYLREKGCFPEDDGDDDDEPCFGDDAFDNIDEL